MTTTLSDFLPSYPPYERSDIDLFNVYDEVGYTPDMYEIIRRKKEFAELTLSSSEEIEQNTLLKHQKFVQRFLSAYTPYQGLLVWHEVGTGKTLTSIAVAENMKMLQQKKALILVKGRSVERTFRKEIRKHYPYYEPIFEDKKATLRQINANINESYEISTFRIFASQIASACKKKSKPDEIKALRAMYSNRVIIIDEVHNLREEKGRENVYDIIHRFLHIVENCKIILLSATPIKNAVEEIASIMNLILPMEKQFNVETFSDYYFPDKITLRHREEFITKTKGYISYLRQSKNQAQRIDAGLIIDTIKGFSIVKTTMGEFQSEQYQEAIKEDGGLQDLSNVFPDIEAEKKRKVIEDDEQPQQERRQVVEDDKEDKEIAGGIYQKSRQAILACFPELSDGRTYGTGKIEKSEESPERLDHYSPNYYKNIARTMIRGSDMDTQLTELHNYSDKYHYVIRHVLQPENTTRKLFVYGEYIGGSGLFLLEQLLVLFGFSNSDKRPQVKKEDNPFEHILYEPPKRRYAIITSKLSDSDISFLLDIFNHPLNDRGQYISVLMGSKTMGESHNLKCIRDIIILTPHWNYTETEQAIGRGIRTGSHSTLPESERNVTIYRLVSMLPADGRTIDQYMYEVSYKKDLMIKQIEYVAREIAVDCTFNKERNTYDDRFIEKRECFYTSCTYTCLDEKPIVKVELTDTYNLFYTEKEYLEIKQLILNQFQSVSFFSYSFDTLLKIVSDQVQFPRHVILRCINEIIERQEIITNPLGFPSYIKEKNNQLFLSYNLLTAKEEDVYYTQQGQLYPIIDPFLYIEQVENYSMDKLIKGLQSSNPMITKRILTTISMERSIIIIKNAIELVHEPHLVEIDAYLRNLLDIAKEITIVDDDNVTIYSTPKQRYEKIDGTGQYHWVILPELSQEYIRQIVNELKTNPAIRLYGYKANGMFYIYNLKDKSFLTDTKRSGAKCDNIKIDDIKEYSDLLPPVDYDPRLSSFSKEKEQLCEKIQKQLKEFTYESISPDGQSQRISFPLLFDHSLQQQIRAMIEQDQEEQEEREKEQAEERKLAKRMTKSTKP